MGWRGPDGVEQLTPLQAREAAEGDRRVGHAEGGEAHLRDGLVDLLRDDGQSIEIRGLPLVSGHAGGGVPLDMLDRLKALASSKGKILCRDVVLPVDKGLLVAIGARGEGADEP